MSRITTHQIQSYLKDRSLAFLPTQRNLCVPIINRIYQKMRLGLEFNSIRVCRDLIIDGHHRYLSALLASQEVHIVPSLHTSATRGYDWASVRFDENDWDTMEKIQELNITDAAFNNLTVEMLLKTIKKSKFI